MESSLPGRTDQDLNVIVLSKGAERYIFFYCDPQTSEILQQFGRFAERGDLSFTWHDANTLRQRIRQIAEAGY